jgi:hypothetical protein
MADAALTLEAAVEVFEDDAPSSAPALPPVQVVEDQDDYSEFLPEPVQETHVDDLAVEALPASEQGLTLDQAAAIYDDRENPIAHMDERPAAIVDGEPVTLTDLVRGYVASKNAEGLRSLIQNEARTVVAAAQGVVDASWGLSELMMGQMIPAPTVALAHASPELYVAQQGLHEALANYVDSVLSQGEEAKLTAGQMVVQMHQLWLQAEAEKLAQVFPQVLDPGPRDEFFNRIRQVAAACGFSEDELRQVVDHRLFILADLAADALELRETQAQEPKKRRRNRRRNKSEAMDRLERTGSFQAALEVDFD